MVKNVPGLVNRPKAGQVARTKDGPPKYSIASLPAGTADDQVATSGHAGGVDRF